MIRKKIDHFREKNNPKLVINLQSRANRKEEKIERITRNLDEKCAKLGITKDEIEIFEKEIIDLLDQLNSFPIHSSDI